MSGGDLDYLEQRAETEIEMAQRAKDSRAVKAHYELANAYLDRLYSDAMPAAG